MPGATPNIREARDSTRPWRLDDRDPELRSSAAWVVTRPATLFIAASSEAAVISLPFFLAISATWALVIWPTLVSGPAVPEPFSIFAALRTCAETGGCLRMKVKVLSL